MRESHRNQRRSSIPKPNNQLPSETLPRAKEWRTVPRTGPSNRTIFPVNFEFVAEQGTQERVGGGIRRWQGLVGRGQGERWRRKRWPPTDPSLARSFIHLLTLLPFLFSPLCVLLIYRAAGKCLRHSPDRATPVSLSLSVSPSLLSSIPVPLSRRFFSVSSVSWHYPVRHSRILHRSQPLANQPFPLCFSLFFSLFSFRNFIPLFL